MWGSSPFFAAASGFGGNGGGVENDPTSFVPAGPGRTGGGCVQGGPFAGVADLVHLGPMDSVVYNPQCLKRDFSPYFAGRYLGMNQTQLTLAAPDFGSFDQVVQGGPSFDASGVHGGGHYGVGGTYGLWILPLPP
jgi:tyrosinase